MSSKEEKINGDKKSAKSTTTSKQPKAAALTLAELIETNALKCTQCDQFYQSPVLLPCLHAFCAACLQALPNTDVTNGIAIKMCQRQCPICHATVTMMVENEVNPFLQVS